MLARKIHHQPHGDVTDALRLRICVLPCRYCRAQASWASLVGKTGVQAGVQAGVDVIATPRARCVRMMLKSVFQRSMPSDLIRGWIPVRVKKTRQNKRLELRSDSIGTEKALEHDPEKHAPHLLRGGNRFSLATNAERVCAVPRIIQCGRRP